MAETLVLANLSIDPSGVVSGIKQSNAAMASGDTALGRFGDAAGVVAGRLFNFRQALIGVTRVLGIAGILTGLAFALKGLVTDLISSTAWFKSAKEAVTDWYNAVIKGEDATERLQRKLKEIGGPVGVKTLFEMRQELEALVKARSDNAALLAAEGRPLKDRIIDWGLYNEAIQKVVDSMHKLGVSRGELELITGRERTTGRAIPGGAVGPTPDAAAPTWDPKKYSDAAARIFEVAAAHEAERLAAAGALEQELLLIDALEIHGQDLINLSGTELQEFWRSEDEATARANAFHEELLAGTSILGPYAAGFEAVGDAADKAGTKIDTAASKINGANIAIDAASAAAASFAGGLAQAAASGNISWRQFIGNMLVQMGTMLLTMAAVATVRGLMGEETQWATVGIAAAAGAAAIAAGRAMGSRANYGVGGGSSGGGGRNRAATTQPQENFGRSADRPTVTVVVQGSMIGTDPDNLARDISRWIDTAQNDGAP